MQQYPPETNLSQAGRILPILVGIFFKIRVRRHEKNRQRRLTTRKDEQRLYDHARACLHPLTPSGAGRSDSAAAGVGVL